MVTVRGSLYSADDYRFIADILSVGISECCEDYEQNCKNCQRKLVCSDLKRARDFCEGIFVNN